MRSHKFLVLIILALSSITLLAIILRPSPLLKMADGNYKFVAADGKILIYNMDLNHKFVQEIPLRFMKSPRGIAANSETDILYIPYFGYRGYINKIRILFGFEKDKYGYLDAIDLKTGRRLWTKKYRPSIDSLAVTPNGQKLYMPSGEERKGEGFWFVLDALSGEELDRIEFVPGAHNTIVNLAGNRVYLASLQHNYLAIADTNTNKIIRKIGPFKERIRPFTVNADESMAFVTINYLSGFEVGSISTGDVLYSVQVEGFPWEDPELPFTQSHGIALTTDESEIWVVDAHNKLVHVFDVSKLPDQKPTQTMSIDVADPLRKNNFPKWINSSRDGIFMHVSTGAIINTETREIIENVEPSRYFLEIEYKDGEPIHAYSRYGLGYGD